MKTKQLLHDIAEKCSKQKHVGDRVLQYRSKACRGKPGIYNNITSRPLALDSHNLTLKPFKIKTMLKGSMDRNDLQNSCTLGSDSALRPPKVIFISSFLHFLSSISYPFYPSTVSATTLGPQLRFSPQTGPWRNLDQGLSVVENLQRKKWLQQSSGKIMLYKIKVRTASNLFDIQMHISVGGGSFSSVLGFKN